MSYQRQSVHDPSIIDDGSGTYQVLGSHMGAAKTTDLMNWSAISGISETADSTLYGVVEAGQVKQAYYNDAFKKNQVTGETTIYAEDGTSYKVDFGEYNMNDWISSNTILGNQWAPDVIYNKAMGKWCMYQSLNGSSWNSAVVLLTADDKNGSYVDTNGTTAIYSKYEMNYSPSAVTNRGQKLMGNYQWDTMEVAEIAQGHNSSFVDSNGRAYVVYHTKFNDGTAGHQLRVHELFTTKDGYVVASPYEFSSDNAKITASTSYTASELTGKYQVITHKYKMKCVDKGGETEVNRPVDIVLNKDGTVTGDLTGTWSNEAGTPYATLVLGGNTYKGVFAKQNISGENLDTMCFTVLDNTTGLCVWGSHEVTDREAIARNVVNYKVTISSNTYNNITLPTEATDGVNISWTSSAPDVIAADGTVTIPDADTDVTLTVTFAKNDASSISYSNFPHQKLLRNLEK